MTTTNIINFEFQKENTNTEKKTDIYKINYKDILFLMDIKKKFILKSINFFAIKILNHIKEKMESDMYINKLKILIGSKIIEKMKEGKN